MTGCKNVAPKLTDAETWSLMSSKAGRSVLVRYRAAVATGSERELQAIVSAVRDRARRRANPGAAVRYATVEGTM